MIQFLAVLIFGSLFGWVTGTLGEIHPLLMIPVLVLIVWLSWLLQTDEEKERTRKWWYDRL